MTVDWKAVFKEKIKILRKEEDKLNQKKKNKQPMYNSFGGGKERFGIDHQIRKLSSAINGAIDFVEILSKIDEIKEQDARELKYELGWLETDLWAIRLGTYPTAHSALLEEQENREKN